MFSLDARSIVAISAAFIGLAGAVAGGLLANWHNLFSDSVAEVVQCDQSLGKTDHEQIYSGIYTGIFQQEVGTANVQLKLVRNGKTVKGSYFRDGSCGKIFGDIQRGALLFRWQWSGYSGRGVAEQIGEKLVGSSGFDNSFDNGGKFELWRSTAED